ncbi:MAG: hypothetical protein BGN87_00075 [Rhizobiales bacterium 65-79]|nr:hypothetical protein [Hyphomicrobiales bacterium]OJU02582.1 MAG: hypothetical protein BGN87_00075 [Rhizobiales bacterium 65-79]
MTELQRFICEYSAVRNANFVLWSALLVDLAETKGIEGGKWLKRLRALAFEQLDVSKLEASPDKYSAEVAEVAERARLLVETTFAMARNRRRERLKR